jgi:hypothetical protein
MMSSEMSEIAGAMRTLPARASEAPDRACIVFFLKISRFLRMHWQAG